MTTISLDSCTEQEESDPLPSSGPVFAEEQTESLVPRIVAVYNGRILDIKEELIAEALGGISIKHYDGNCYPPEDGSVKEKDFLLGEDYFDYEESVLTETETMTKTMSSMIRFCYEPKNRGSAKSENAPEDMSDYQDKPLCLQEQINFRNSFWDLHRPELCKLGWPHLYVGEATVIQHLHRHLLKHGAICSGFHEQRDLLAMLDKELDLYDKLKTIQSPRELPQREMTATDHRGHNRKMHKMKLDPCKPTFKPIPKKEGKKNIFNNNNNRNGNIEDDDLEPTQTIHLTKEEFCITIGRPTRNRAADGEEGGTDGRIEKTEIKQIWLPYDGGEFERPGEYSYSDYCFDSTDDSEAAECQPEEYSEMEEVVEKESTSSEEPPVWVEPDYCSMI